MSDFDEDRDEENGDLPFPFPPVSLRQPIQNLWGMGYTVVPRKSFNRLYDEVQAPMGMAYQWLDRSEADGWKPVAHERYPGMFAPIGTGGDISHGDLYLMERPAKEVEAFHQAAHAKARKNVEDWYARQQAAGFTGSVTILGESSEVGSQSAEVNEIGETIVARTQIPPDLHPYLPELLDERDRLVAAATKASMETLTGIVPDVVSLRISCFKLAMASVRQKHGLSPHIDERTKTIEDDSIIPDDLLDRAGEIFALRDILWANASMWWGRDTPEYRSYQEVAAANPEWTRGQLMNSVLMNIAVEKVRHLRTEGKL